MKIREKSISGMIPTALVSSIIYVTIGILIVWKYKMNALYYTPKESIIIFLFIIFIVFTAIFSRIFWYKMSMILHLVMLLMFGLLVFLVIIMAFLRLLFEIFSIMALWFMITLIVAMQEAFVIVSYKSEKNFFSTILFILLIIFSFAAYLITYIFPSFVSQAYFIFYIFIVIEVIVIAQLITNPLMFFNIYNAAIIIGFCPFIYIFNSNLIIDTIVITMVLLFELYIQNNLFRRELNEMIVKMLKKKFKKEKIRNEIPLSDLFNTDFILDLRLFGETLVHLLFKELDGKIKWEEPLNDMKLDGVLVLPLGKWIDSVKSFFSEQKTTKVKLSTFLSSTGLNIYKLELIKSYFDKTLIVSEENEIIYYFDKDDQIIFDDPLKIIDRLIDLLNFCPEAEFIKYMLKQGATVTKLTLYWLLEQLIKKKLELNKVLQWINDQANPFDYKKIIKSCKKAGIKGFAQVLIDEFGIGRDQIKKLYQT